MSSLNDYIKFVLDIKDPNVVFKDYFYKILNDSLKYKFYVAELTQPACPFCGFLNLIHNGRLKTHFRYLTANASIPQKLYLKKFNDLEKIHPKYN